MQYGVDFLEEIIILISCVCFLFYFSTLLTLKAADEIILKHSGVLFYYFVYKKSLATQRDNCVAIEFYGDCTEILTCELIIIKIQSRFF